MILNSVKDLDVYKKTYELAMTIFRLRKTFPDEERFALTGQIRRSSRSVCLNLSEAWSKRRYEAHFISKLTECDGENSETDSSLDFAKDCGYITAESHAELVALCQQVGRMLGSVIKNPGPFLKCSLLVSGFFADFGLLTSDFQISTHFDRFDWLC